MRPFFATRPFLAEPGWPESWQVAHAGDRVEIWGERTNPGYAGAYHNRMGKVLDALRRHTPSGGKVLDVAGAHGNYSLSASALGYDVTWNDLRGELEEYVRSKSPEAERIEFVPGNIFELSERFRGHFDSVLALEVIEHVAHPDEMMRLLGTMLKPEGRLILTTPNGGYFRNKLPRFSDCDDPSVFESGQFKPDTDGHIFLLHEDEIRRLAGEAGLRVVEYRLSTNPLTASFLGTRYLRRLLPDSVIAAVEHVTARLPGPLSRRINLSSLAVLAHA